MSFLEGVTHFQVQGNCCHHINACQSTRGRAVGANAQSTIENAHSLDGGGTTSSARSRSGNGSSSLENSSAITRLVQSIQPTLILPPQ